MSEKLVVGHYEFHDTGFVKDNNFPLSMMVAMTPKEKELIAEVTRLKQDLKDVVAAWDILPAGYHSHIVVQKWLRASMKPIMDRIRSRGMK